MTEDDSFPFKTPTDDYIFTLTARSIKIRGVLSDIAFMLDQGEFPDLTNTMTGSVDVFKAELVRLEQALVYLHRRRARTRGREK
ncbi:hypothetical protein HYPGJ_31598 [Hyphomicrobium sp. GJ21]|uniref:hypothetical protein n=1 Tax=Hyphomicrobium sp. GJ21 TaxID=113574 RepID=UPI000622B882|nr:hypothetical protein [Hyphomicrobium sp. GJ21]CEJ88106.1 hypothetical protein HYPGJ_31598 [Hyphomicrobium sp. GJ21]